jgi:cell division protein FtsI (penicillin-binding protein 3)
VADQPKNKIRIIFAFFCFAFLLILGKAFKIQVIDKKKLIERSKSQIFRENKVYPHRGNIYDRNGNPLAINIKTYSLFTIPKSLKNENESYKKLSKVIPQLTYDAIKKKVKNRKRYTWLARKIQLTEKQVLAVKKIKGVYIDQVPKRLYPNHEIAGQVLGFVGIDNVGLAGIEYKYNKELKGKPRVVKYVKDNKGRAIKFESEELITDDSKTLNLSIDKDLQAVGEKYLKEYVDKYDADSGGFGVMDAQSGEILAVGNYPTFDPNFVNKSNSKNRRLSFLTDPVEPGSSFKTFTIISAFENNIAKRDTAFYCERGELTVEGHVISEAESKKTYEWLTVEEILRYSSNIGTTKLAFDLTYPRLRKTLKNFGFGKKTGIGFPGESRGIFTDKDNVSPLSLSNISFGQGVATTGVQMLSAYSAIANGGNYIKPTLIKDGNKNIKSERVIPKEIANSIKEILVKAVEDGTGSNAKIPYFKIAGKTSTAQRVAPEGGYKGYVPGFIGFPIGVKKPFVVYVYVRNPKGLNYYGNAIAAPVFKKITEYLLYKNKDFGDMAKVGTGRKIRGGSDFVRVQHAATRLSSKGRVPNFIGLDKKSSERLAKKLGINLIHRGRGVVKVQSLEFASPLPKKDAIVLNYAPPKYD